MAKITSEGPVRMWVNGIEVECISESFTFDTDAAVTPDEQAAFDEMVQGFQSRTFTISDIWNWPVFAAMVERIKRIPQAMGFSRN